MNSKKAAFISAAILLTVSAAACGKVEKESSDVALDINTSTSEVETTVASEDDSKSVTTSVTTTSGSKGSATTTKKGYNAKSDGEIPTTAAPHNADPDPNAPDPPSDDPGTPAPQEPEPTAPPADDPPTEPPTDPPVQNVEFNYDSLQSDVSAYISALPLQFTKGGGAACTAGGYDVVTYKCSDIEIECYVDGGTERIFHILINSAGFPTAEGIAVGSTRADVEAAYGAGEDLGGFVSYISGSKELSIYYSGDSVTCIEYYIAV